MGDTPFQCGPSSHKGGSDHSNSKGEEDFEEDDSIIHTAEYNEKFSIVLNYKPFLETMIQRLEKATEKSREAQLIKMQSLYDILFNPTKQLRLGTIVRCEKVLKSLYEKIEKSTIRRPEENNKIGDNNSCTITKPAAEETTSVLIEIHQKEVINNDTMTDLEKESDMMRYSNLNNDFKSINVNDLTNSQKSGDFSTSKVNEESRRKLCNIIKKQRQEEFESSAINNKNEQITSGSSASTLVDLNVSTPSNNVRSLEIDNNHLNVTHSDTEPVLQPKFDVLQIVENSKSVNFVSPSDRVPFSSTAVDDYNFESLDIDDRKRYLSWDQQNMVKFDQSDKKEKSIPQECSPISTNLHRHDILEINQNTHTSRIQDISYKSPTEYTGLNNLETLSGNPYKPPFENESTDLISPKNNTNYESSKPLPSENRPQSLREKLTEEISAVHKVGTSCGGALRSLLHRDDKIIAPNRMANLKAGTIMDLIGKDKPPTRISFKPKSNFGKGHDDRSKLHNIPLPHPQPTPLALNDNNNTNVFPHLGFENSNTLTALTRMNPKELERIVHDHILKLPNSSETGNSNLIKEGDFTSNHSNSESDRNIVHPNVSNVRTNNILSSSTASLSDPRNGIHNLGTALNIPRYDSPMQNYPTTSGFPSNLLPFSQQFNAQSPATNVSHKFVYNEGTQGNHPLGYKTNIEPEDHMLTTGVYTNPGIKNPDNICNRNQQSNNFVNYNNPSSEHWKLDQNQGNAYSRNQTTNHYHHSPHQPDRFKWIHRTSTCTDSTSGYNVHNRNSVNQSYNSNKNLNTTKESRISDSGHRNRSVPSQRPISARDPRRRSLEEPNRSKSNDRNFCKTEQPKNSRNTDPRLSRNSKRGNHDYISNRDPRMHDSSSSTMYPRNRSHEKNNTNSENDFKSKGTFSSPLDKLYTATSELKTGKGYGPQKFKIPKLKTSQNSDILDKNKNELPCKNKSKEIKIMDKLVHNKNKQLKYPPQKTVPDGQSSSNLKKDSLPINNRHEEEIKEDNASDDDIKPPKNSKPKKNLWDESIESTSSYEMSLDEKEVGSKQGRKKEDKKPKDKRAKVKISTKKLVDEQNNKKNIENSVEVEVSRSDEVELENKIGDDLCTNDDNCLKVPTNSDTTEIISQSKVLSTNISANPASNKKIKNPASPESKIKEEEMRNMFPSSLWDLLASEEKMKFFSKLGENLNAEKLKRIKQIIESNSDDEENAKKNSPPPAQIEAFSNTIEKVQTKISPSSSQIFENCEKQYENPVCSETQITKNEDLTPLKNHKEKINDDKSSLINVKSVIQEGHTSLEAIDGNVKDEEGGVLENDLNCENSKAVKKGRAKKMNTKKGKILPASGSLDVQNKIEKKKPKKKQKNELEKLQEDIRDMFISKGVVAATGMRLCRLRKAIDAVGLGNDPSKEPVGPILRENKSCKNQKDKKTVLSDDSDNSEEGEKFCKKKITSRRSSNQNSNSSKKFNKEDNVPSTSVIQKQIFNKIDTNGKEKSVKIGTDLLSSEKIGSPIVIIEKADLTKFVKTEIETDVPHGKKPSKIVTTKNKTEKKPSKMLTKKNNKSFIENNNISSVKQKSADPKAQKSWAIKVQRKYKIKKPKKCKKKPVKKCNVEDLKFEENVDFIKLEEVVDDIHYYQERENVIYKCKICAYVGKLIVRHYVGTHPGEEVMISRISPDSAKQAIEESNIMKFGEIQNNTVSSKRKKKIFNCRMCSRSFPNSVTFFDHVSFHTGEYRYECHMCKTRVSSKSGLKSHLLSSHYGGKKVGLQIKGTVYKDPPNSDLLLGYLCSECNFVQLISTNMDKHLKINHNENTLSKLSKAITINLSKPTSNQEIYHPSLIHETKDNIVLLPKMESKLESIDETIESSEIKVEQPSDITIMDITDMSEEFQLNSNIVHVVESNINDASVGNKDHEGQSNPPKEVDLNVFLGYENITIEDDELNMERERIMNDIVIKLKTQTKPQKDSVLDQIQTKLNKTDIDDDAMENKDSTNETSSPRSRSYLTKEKLGDFVNNYSPEESDLPVRRTLPERSCKEKGQIGLYTKGKRYTNIEDDSDSSMGEFELELKKYVEELRMSTSDHSDIDDDLNNDLINAIEIGSSKVLAIKNKPMSSTIIRLQDTLNRPESVYNTSENESLIIDDDIDQCEGNEIILLPEPSLQTTCEEMDNYIANFGSHVAHIDKLPLTVGPLEVYNSNGCVIYRCHFNCDFISTSMVAFGEHIKTHPRYSCAWNGRCFECNIIYSKEDGKPTLYALTTAFSHLLTNHLFQHKTHVALMNNVMKVPRHKIPPPPPVLPLSEYYKSLAQSSDPPKPKGPLLRVRRLSGDMLSAPAVENSLTPNNSFQNQEVPSDVLETADITDLVCYENVENNVLETNLPETPEDEMCNFLRIESVVSLNPENSFNFSQPVMESESNATISLSKGPRSYISLPQQSPVQQSVSIITLDSSPVIQYITSPEVCNIIPMDVDAIMNYATTSNNMDVLNTPEMTSPVSLNSHQLNQRSPMAKRNLNLKTVGSNAKTKVTRVKFSELKKTVIDYKSISAYDEMLVPKKLRHFYKCMGQVCTFSCASMEKFAVHYEQHRSQSVLEDPERAWRVCPYCFKSFDCARDYCIHMKKEHGYSNMQCSFCFYRSATLGNVLYHQNTCHITMKMQVLECESQGLGPLPHRDIQFDYHIKPYVCGQGKCSMFSFIPENFRQHLQIVHHQLNMFRCHLCVGFTASLDRLIEHYAVHGIAMYQCLFCVHGTLSDDEMREHLCYVHSNNHPSAVKRVDITTKSSDKTSNKQHLERLKRINFKELEEKTHTVIPFPSGENNEVVCNTSNRNASEVDSITLSEINIDDDIQIINTVKKADKIVEVICLDSSDEDVYSETSTPNKKNRPMSKVLPHKKKIKVSTPILSPSKPNKRKVSPTLNISDDSQSVLTNNSSFDESPAIKKFKENSGEEFNINQPSLFQNDDLEQIIKTIPNVMVVKESSLDTHIKPTTASNTKPTSGLTGIELFRCGNTGCDHGVQDSLLLKEHLGVCDLARNSQMLTCVHCNKLFKYTSSYIEHVRVHGTLRYRCSLCEFKAPVPLRVGTHMKQVHRISSTKVEPMNPREKDHDVDQFVCIPKVNSKGGKGNTKKNNGSKSTTPTKFSLTDIDKIPFSSIFASALGCSSCTYETKVRSNLVQHLTLHAAGHSVPQEEMVNPVPCLDKHEKMFDKMMNLASSSHKNSDKGLFQEVMKEEKNQFDYPVYIPSNQRYVCHAEGCTYVTIDDNMLRYHIRTLHNEETTYRCPHCPSTDPLSLMPIDRLSTHLKMHDKKLYSCSACSYYHFSRYVVERHVNDKHPKIIASSKIVRETGTSHTEEVSKCDDVGATENLPLQPKGTVNQSNSEKKMWHCNLCKFRTADEKTIRLHGRFSHGMTNQYKCRLCVYESDVFTNFEDHFSKFHPNLPTQIITSFSKVVEMPSNSSIDSGTTKPQGVKTYWRRNSNTVKHIRGILLDEETSAAKTSAVSIAKAATSTSTAVSMIKIPANVMHIAKSSAMSTAKTPALSSTKTNTATTMSIPKEDPKPEFVPPLSDKKYGPYGEPTSGNLYQCPLCKQTYKYRRDFKDHIFRELDYTPWVCTHCGKSFINKTSVTKHIKMVHDRDTGIDLIILNQPSAEIETWVNNVFSVQQSLMNNLVVRVACRSKVQKKGIITVNTTTQKKLVQKKGIISGITTTQKKLARDNRKGQPSTNTEKITKEDDNQELVMKRKKSATKGQLNFMCGYCSTATVLRKSLRSHQLKKHPDRPLLILNSDGTPEVMKRKRYNVKSNSCNLRSDDCPLIEEEEEKMEVEEIHDIPYYSCCYCKWSSQSISIVKDHWKSLHKEPIYFSNNAQKPGTGVDFLYKKSKCSSESAYGCHWCKKQGSLSFLKQHGFEHNASRSKANHIQRKYKCSQCDLIVSSVDVLKRHFALDHKKMELSYIVVQPPNETSIIDDKEEMDDHKDCIKSFKCLRCPFTSQKYRSVVRHLQKHFRIFYCGVCNHQYLSYPGLRSHMNLKHPHSSVKPNIVQPSDSDIEKIKKEISVVEECCNKKILDNEFKVPKSHSLKIKKKVTKTCAQKCSASVTCKESTTKKKNFSKNLLKLNPKSKPKTKCSLKSKDTKKKIDNINSTDILKNSKTGNRPKLQLLNQVGTITFVSNSKTVKMSWLDFTKLFKIIYPKIQIRKSLIVHP